MAGAFYFDPTEDSLLEEANRRRQFILGYQADEETANRVAAHANAWPQNSPGVSLALAKAGVNPEDEVAKEAARLSQKKIARKRKGIGGFLDRVGDVVGTGVKGAVRGATTIVSAPFEEAAGLLRSTAGTIGGRLGGAVSGALGGAGLGAAITAPTGLGAIAGAVGGGVLGAVGGFLGGDKIEGEGGFRFQSTLAQAISQIDEDGGIQLGSGFMPGGKAEEVAVRERQRTATISGHALTLGRLTATAIAEPGSKPYRWASGLIDFGAAMKLDPTAVAGLKVAKVRAARRTLLGEKGMQWLNEPGGAAVIKRMTEMDDPWEIWNMSRRQLDVDTAVRLADSTDEAMTKQILEGALGTQLRERFLPTETGGKIPFGGWMPSVRRVRGKARLTLDLPATELNWDDPARFVEDLDAFQALAKVPSHLRLENNRRAMRALAGPRTGRFEQIKAIQDTMASVLIGHGIDAADAKRLTNMLGDQIPTAREYTAAEIALGDNVPRGLIIDSIGDEIVENEELLGEILGGGNSVPTGRVTNSAGITVPEPTLISEMLDTPLHLPGREELRALRQDIGVLKRMYNAPVVGDKIRGSTILLNHFQNKVWKVGTLARLAIIPRIGIDEQARMAFAGHDSVFSHPLSYIMWMVGRRGGVSALGDDIADAAEAQRALSAVRAREGFFESHGGSVVGTNRQRLRPDQEGFLDGWLNHELGHLRADPIAQHYAKHGAEATKQWLWEGEGRKYLNELRQWKPDNPNFMRTQLDVSLYVDDVIGQRVATFTRGDQRLLDFVGSGVSDAERVARRVGDKLPANAKAKLDEAKRILGELHASGNVPEAAVADIPIRAGSQAAKLYDNATSWMFEQLMARPTNRLARVPTFKQSYWKHSEEMVGSLVAADQQRLLANARKAKLSSGQIKRIEQAIAKGSGDLKLKELDEVAKGLALEDTMKLLYDLSKRNAGLDAFRLIFPFAEPWKEALTTWPKLIRGPVAFSDDPLAALASIGRGTRRFQQTVEGARGAGWFYNDPATGEEMFAYPGSEFITGLVTGSPMRMQGFVKGLNLFANSPLMPGFGPLVQVPANAIIPDKPDFDWLREMINPVGETDRSVIEQFFAPAAWVDKIQQAVSDPETDRLFGNTVFDSARWLHSTGKYDLGEPGEQERLSRDAVVMARKVYGLRVLGSFVLPASPTPEWISGIKDPEQGGRLMTQWKLADEFRKLQEEDYDTAVEKFMNLYGEEGLLFMQPKSESIRGGPATDQMADFARNNPDLVDKYPDVYHFFGPQGGEFSYAAYQRQLATGERKALSPKEAMKLANHRVAQMAWKKAKDKVGARPNSVQREWLDKVREALLQKFPGWEPDTFTIGEANKKVTQLQQAVKDPKLKDTEVGQALTLYFAARDKAIEAARAQGLSDHRQAKSAAPLRDWLRNIAEKLVDRYPDSAVVFDRVLFSEMKDDVPTGEA